MIVRHLFVTLFRHRATVCCLAALLLCGCALFFRKKHSLLSTVPAGALSPFTLKAHLTRSTRYIEFVGFEGQSGSDQRLRITIVNRGRSTFLAQQSDGKSVPVVPNASVELFNYKIEKTTNSLRFWLTDVRHRTPCDLRLEISDPSRFHDAIKVYLFISSAPM
jgi:hypothetical protein